MVAKLMCATLATLLVAALTHLQAVDAQPQAPPCVAPCFNVIFLVNLTGNPAVGSPAWTNYVTLLKKSFAQTSVNANIRTFAIFQPNTPQPPGQREIVSFFPYSVGVFYTFAGLSQFSAFQTAQKNDPTFQASRALITKPSLYFGFQKPAVGALPQPQPSGPPCVQFSCTNVIYLFRLIGNPTPSSCTYQTFESFGIKAFAASTATAAYQLSPAFSPVLPENPGTIFTTYSLGVFYAFSSSTTFGNFRASINADPNWVAVRSLATQQFILSFTLVPF